MTHPDPQQSDGAPRPPPPGMWDINGHPPVDLTYAQAAQVVSMIHTHGLGGEQPTIGGYQLIDTIGEGGSAVAYRAIRAAGGSEHPVFLKVFRPGGPSRNGQLLRELAILQSLKLDAVPRLIDVGSERGVVYLATELIDGPPLHAWLAEHKPSLTQRVELLARICRAVQQLHEHGVIHRDLKPANILVTNGTQGPRPFLVDMGIAHVLSSGDNPAPNTPDAITTAGAPLGSPGWCAPEQARGQHADVSTRSDVFALGAVGHWLAIGRDPRETNPSVALAIAAAASTPLPPVRSRDASVPPQLAAVIDKATAFNAADRYASAADLGDDLERWLHHEPVLATPPTLWQSFARWIARHPAKSAVYSTLLVCTAIVVGSIASVRYVNHRPAYVMKDSTRAELRSLSGRVFRTVQGDTDGLLLADIVARSPSRGGGRVFVVAAKGDREPDGFPYDIALWDADDPAQLLWTTQQAPPLVIPPGVEQLKHPTFVVCGALLANVIPEPAGEKQTPELIAAFRDRSNGPCCIRVFDLSGRLLTEAWHNGWIKNMYWIPRATLAPDGSPRGRLVCLGVTNDYHVADFAASPSSYFAAHPEIPRVRNFEHTSVLFSFDPSTWTAGQVIAPPSPPAKTSTDQSASLGLPQSLSDPGTGYWYRYLSPLDAFSACSNLYLGPPKLSQYVNDSVTLGASWGTASAPNELRVLLTINANGEVVHSQQTGAWLQSK